MSDKFLAQKQRYIQYWNMENHDRPILNFRAPKPGGSWPRREHPTLEARWTDVDFAVARFRAQAENTYCLADALPVVYPNLGPDILGAVMGCGLEFGENTSWALHNVTDWDTHPELKFDPDNRYWKIIMAITKAALEDSNGDYIVGITDLHPGLDGLVSVRGPQELCFDLLECPDEIHKRTEQTFEVFRTIYNTSYDILTKTQQGSSTFMGGTWHPGRWYPTSCDFSCMISPDAFAEFVMPDLKKQLAMLDISLYHLDGPDALRHLDALLAIPELGGIQWVPGEGQKPQREWTDVLQKIQAAGKRIWVHVTPEDIEPLCRALRPEGVLFTCHFPSKEQGEDMIRFVEGFYKGALN